MKKTKIIIVMLIIGELILLTGCGKNENIKNDSDNNDNNSIIQNQKISKINFSNNDLAKGNIKSFVATDDGYVITTKNNDVYLLDLFTANSEVKSYKITNDNKINNLVYAKSGIIYSNNHFIYYEKTGNYDENLNYTYTFNKINKLDITNDKNLLYVSDEANFYAYIDNNNNIIVKNRKNMDSDYTTYSNIEFIDIGSEEKSNIKTSKAIYNFILTEENKLLYIKNGQTISSFGDETGVSIRFNDITNKINEKIIDIYNVQNSSDSCYVVTENNNIYFVEIEVGDIKSELITNYSNIDDIKGYNGKPKNIIIKTKNGDYYYYQNEKVNQINELANDYLQVELLMDYNIVALNKDGYLYNINIQN